MRSTTAIILAGGRGTRLGAFPGPKCLLPIKGVPLLWRILDSIESHVTDVVICTGYRADDVANSIHARGKTKPVLAAAGADASMAQRIIHALQFVKTDQALILYGDTIANVDLPELERVHDDANRAVTMTLYQMRSPFGIAKLIGQQVAAFEEKPTLPHWYNIGYILSHKANLAYIAKHSFYTFEAWLHMMADTGHLNAYFHRGQHFTVNTFRELEEMEAGL